MSEDKKPYKYCIVPLCGNTTITTPNKTFISVPKHENIRKKWCDVMKRDSEKYGVLSTKSVRFCCEDHFNLEDDVENYMKWKMMGGNIRLKKGVMPHIFNQSSGTVRPNRPAIKRRRIETLNSLYTSEETQPSTSSSIPIEWVDCGRINIEGDILDLPSRKKLKHKKVQVRRQDFLKSKYTQTEDSTNKTTAITSPFKISALHTEISLPKWEPSEDSDCSSNCCSDLAQSTFQSESVNENDITSDQEYKSIMLKGTLMSIEKEPKLYLGIPNDTYFSLEILAKKIPAPHIDILITLKKIRLNEPYTILGMQFARTSVNIEEIFRRTVPLISNYLKEFIVWPRSDKVPEHLPMAFRSRYSKVQSIIDCLEIQIQNPSSTLHQLFTTSDCKSCKTVKYMISYTPDGLVNFVSSRFDGGKTDSAIFKNCGFVDNLSPDMHIMAVRGFKNIDNILMQRLCKLVRPPSVSNYTSSTKKEECKRTEPLRNHIKRVIGRPRDFNFLLPYVDVDLENLSLLDEVVLTVCGLINLQNNQIKF